MNPNSTSGRLLEALAVPLKLGTAVFVAALARPNSQPADWGFNTILDVGPSSRSTLAMYGYRVVAERSPDPVDRNLASRRIVAQAERFVPDHIEMVVSCLSAARVRSTDKLVKQQAARLYEECREEMGQPPVLRSEHALPEPWNRPQPRARKPGLSA